jgi:hypothetical protein
MGMLTAASDKSPVDGTVDVVPPVDDVALRPPSEEERGPQQPHARRRSWLSLNPHAATEVLNERTAPHRLLRQQVLEEGLAWELFFAQGLAVDSGDAAAVRGTPGGRVPHGEIRGAVAGLLTALTELREFATCVPCLVDVFLPPPGPACDPSHMTPARTAAMLPRAAHVKAALLNHTWDAVEREDAAATIALLPNARAAAAAMADRRRDRGPDRARDNQTLKSQTTQLENLRAEWVRAAMLLLSPWIPHADLPVPTPDAAAATSVEQRYEVALAAHCTRWAVTSPGALGGAASGVAALERWHRHPTLMATVAVFAAVSESLHRSLAGTARQHRWMTAAPAETGGYRVDGVDANRSIVLSLLLARAEPQGRAECGIESFRDLVDAINRLRTGLREQNS